MLSLALCQHDREEHFTPGPNDPMQVLWQDTNGSNFFAGKPASRAEDCVTCVMFIRVHYVEELYLQKQSKRVYFGR
jgi:hypothetical protein